MMMHEREYQVVRFAGALRIKRARLEVEWREFVEAKSPAVVRWLRRHLARIQPDAVAAPRCKLEFALWWTDQPMLYASILAVRGVEPEDRPSIEQLLANPRHGDRLFVVVQD